MSVLRSLASLGFFAVLVAGITLGVIGGVTIGVLWLLREATPPDPVEQVLSDPGYLLDFPGSEPEGFEYAHCDSGDLTVKRQFTTGAQPAEVFGFYDQLLPEHGWHPERAGEMTFVKDVGPIEASLFVHLWDDTFVIQVSNLTPAPC